MKLNNIFRYWIPWILVSSTLFYLASRSGDEIPKWEFWGADKIFHALYYFIVGFLSARLIYYRLGKQSRFMRQAQIGALIIVLLFGIIDESLQSTRPGRYVELLDILADFIGGILAATVFPLYRDWVLPLEAKLARWWQRR